MFDIIIKTKDSKKIANYRCVLNHCSIGKSRDNLVQLRGWTVANVHAEIQQEVDGLFIEDKGSPAGTFINNKKIDRYGPLADTDKIMIGSYQIEIKSINTDDTDASLRAIKVPKERTQGKPVSKKNRSIWRNHVHQELLRNLDLRRINISDMDEAELRSIVQTMIDEVIQGMAQSLPEGIDKQRLAREVLDETIGLGPLEDLLRDETITEIMVNCYNDIYVEKGGRLQKTEVSYTNDAAVMSTIERIVSPLGRRIDESSPMVDARLKDGSRVNAIIPPLALKGPCLTIRKFSEKKLTADDMIKFGSLNLPMVQFLKTAVEQKRNIIISGGTGSGKTTLLNVLSNFIPKGERVVTIEDAAELRLVQPHLVSLEARPPNMEGKGEITIRDLVKNCLRMRPDRIDVGECRGGEALDMLQAMNTGHDGSLTTAHANTPRDLLSRLEVMVMMSGMELPIQAIREQVASAVNIVVQQTRHSDGSRRITHISEITGVESGVVQMQDIFRYQQEGFDNDGHVKGRFIATGRVPEFYEDLRQRGVKVDMSIFQ